MARRHRRQLLKNTYRERSIYKRRMLVCAVMLVMMTGVLVYRYTLLQIIDYWLSEARLPSTTPMKAVG